MGPTLFGQCKVSLATAAAATAAAPFSVCSSRSAYHMVIGANKSKAAHVKVKGDMNITRHCYSMLQYFEDFIEDSTAWLSCTQSIYTASLQVYDKKNIHRKK